MLDDKTGIIWPKSWVRLICSQHFLVSERVDKIDQSHDANKSCVWLLEQYALTSLNSVDSRPEEAYRKGQHSAYLRRYTNADHSNSQMQANPSEMLMPISEILETPQFFCSCTSYVLRSILRTVYSLQGDEAQVLALCPGQVSLWQDHRGCG